MNKDHEKNHVFTFEEARDYNEVAGTFFTPAFPVIVSNIIEKCGITRGLALDLGSGPAHLAMEMARQSNLRILALDISPHILHFARENIAREGLSGRIQPVVADTQALPVRDGAVDLVISRGSLFAWNLERAFREIYRVLRPRGRACVGLGLGSGAIREEIDSKMKAQGRQKKHHPAGNFREQKGPLVRQFLEELFPGRYEISDDDAGFWVYLEKGR